MTDNERLCVCCQFVARTVESGQGYAHQPSLQNLHASAQAGCPLCAILWESFSNLKDFPGLKSNDAKDISISFCLADGKFDSSDDETTAFDTEPYFWFRMEYRSDPMKDALNNPVNIKVVPVEGKSSHPVIMIICLSQLI
jgi:hypothetical protein